MFSLALAIKLSIRKLLIISGPTASGKTALAVKIAKKFNSELISADSRQIYKYLDIGVGKDHPKGFPIHLIDLIEPNQKFSVSQFRKLTLEKISEIQAKNKLPILVGGSGFYIDAVINPRYNTFFIKPNFVLRKILFRLPVSLLQLFLKIVDKKTLLKLNNSDFNNPIRLVRKIEIKLSTPQAPLFQGGVSEGRGGFDVLHLSLTAPRQYLYDRIDARVESRLKQGHIKELKSLLKKYKWSDPGLKISAYITLKLYIKHLVETHDRASLQKIKDKCLQKWKYAEHRDARRQLTWFKKYTHGFFIDITNPNYQKEVFKTVNKFLIKNYLRYNQS